MSNLQDKINTFFKKRNEIFKKPLEKKKCYRIC